VPGKGFEPCRRPGVDRRPLRGAASAHSNAASRLRASST
jgi:hypothetical protein